MSTTCDLVWSAVFGSCPVTPVLLSKEFIERTSLASLEDEAVFKVTNISVILHFAWLPLINFIPLRFTDSISCCELNNTFIFNRLGFITYRFLSCQFRALGVFLWLHLGSVNRSSLRQESVAVLLWYWGFKERVFYSTHFAKSFVSSQLFTSFV